MNELSRTISKDNAAYPVTMTEIYQHISDCHAAGYDAVITVAPNNEKLRSDQQRKAIEVYCRNIAKVLCDAGLTMQVVIEKIFKNTEITPTQARVKEDIIKPVVSVLFEKNSTTKLDSSEVTKVYENVSMLLANRLGVVPPPFPDSKAPPLETYDRGR